MFLCLIGNEVQLMNLFIDSLLQYSALAEVIVDIQDMSSGDVNRTKIAYFNVKGYISQVYFDVFSHILIVVTKIIGPLSACVLP